MKKPCFGLTLDMAGLLIRVDSEIDLNRLKDLDKLALFRSEKNEHFDCRLSLKSSRPPLPRKNKYIFNPADNWKVFKTAKGFVVEVGVPDKMGDINEVIVLNADYTKGRVYRKNIFELSRYFLDQFLAINLLSRREGFILHSCGLIWKNKGLVFAGRSGAGKSTLLKLFGNDPGTDILLNDDRIAVRRCSKTWRIFGTPWHGDLPVVSSASAPLEVVYFIKQSPKNYLRPLSPGETCQTLFQHSLLPYWDELGMKSVLDSFKLLVQEIPAYELGVVPDKRIVKFVTSRLR
jgi:hypothetical protein